MASPVPLSTLVDAAFRATGVAMLMFAIGALCAIYPRENPLLNATSRKAISVIVVKIFVPALAFYSLLQWGADVSGVIWWVVPWCGLNLLLSVAVSYSVGKWFLRLNEEELVVFYFSGALGNVGISLLVMETLCKQPILAQDFTSDDECVNTATGMLILSSLPWRILAFGIFQPMLEKIANKRELKITSEMEITVGETATADDESPVSTPPALKNTTGIWTKDGPETTSTVNNDLGFLRSIFDSLRKCFLNVNVLIPVLVIAVAKIPGLSKALVGTINTQPTLPIIGDTLSQLARPVVSLMIMVGAAGLVPEKGSNWKQEILKPQSIKATISLTLIRFFIMPGIFCLFGFLLRQWQVFEFSRLQWLVMFVSIATPTAHAVTVICTFFGLHDLAQLTGPWNLIQYSLMMVFILIWILVALLIVTYD